MSGVTQRKGSKVAAAADSGEAPKAAPAGAASTGKERLRAMIMAAEKRVPVAVRPYLGHFASALVFLITVWELTSPHVALAWTTAVKVYNTLPEDILMVIAGVGLCLFGGTFSATIAAFEAFRMTGWDQTKQALGVLEKNYQVVKKKHEEDDKKDDDGDGIADVLQIDASELLMRKAHLVLTSVDDPEAISDALVGIGSSCLAVVAVLRVQFAKTVTLAVSIGDLMRTAADKYVTPLIMSVVPAEYGKWIPIVINYTCKTIAISIAWYISKVMSAIHSGIKGGLMVARHSLNYANKQGWLNLNHEETQLDEIVGWSLAAFGVLFQLSFGFSLPFPFNLLLLPVSILEWVIIYFVSDTEIQVA